MALFRDDINFSSYFTILIGACAATLVFSSLQYAFPSFEVILAFMTTVCVVISILCMIFVTMKAIGNLLDNNKNIDTHKHNAEDSNADIDIQKTLNKFIETQVIDEKAWDCKYQLNKIEYKSKIAHTMIEDRFGSSTLTGSKFLSTVDDAVYAVNENCKRAIELFDTFDAQDYLHRKQSIKTPLKGIFKGTSFKDRDYVAMYDKKIQKIDNLILENDKMILGIENIITEMIDNAEQNSSVDSTLTELDNIARRLPFYKTSSDQ